MQKPAKAAEKSSSEPWISPRDLLHFTDLAPGDRFCDLILTGGVTSAVAYPGLVAVLASSYRFHAIGGSSSGAGIAAIAAAAEYRRRHGSAEGFRVMLERLQALAEEDRLNRTRLLHLFQPARGHRLLFNLLKRAFAGPGREFAAFGWALLRQFLPIFLGVSVVVVMWICAAAAPTDVCGPVRLSCAGLAAAVAWTLIVTVVLGLLRLWLALRRVVRSDYGLCTGLAPTPNTRADRQALTEWLHGVIQEVAGRGRDDPPLTFEELARAPGSPRAVLGAAGASADEGISLQMFSASVTHGRPYRFPLQDSEELYFMPSELRRVLPAKVVDHLLAACRARKITRWEADSSRHEEQARWRLPGRDMPVILAARMSVSFPLLFTVVRLWAPHVACGKPGMKDLHPCIFMDGGLCSNFPIHLFDSALPAWPTFGVSLHDMVEERGTRGKFMGSDSKAEVFLPTDDEAGRAEWRYDFDEIPKPAGRLAGLIGALLATVKDWNDATTARMPGVWDRVVRIRLEKDQGGLNIAMPGKTILRVAHKGVVAGRLLLDRFSEADAPNGFASGWNEHRWARLIRLRAALGRHLQGVGWSSVPGRHAEAMTAQIERALDEPPPKKENKQENKQENKLTRAQVAALGRTLDALVQAEQVLNAPEPPLPEQQPQAELHVRAPL